MRPHADHSSGLRARGSASYPITVSDDSGREAYARVQNLRRQVIAQAQNRVVVHLDEDPTLEGDHEQHVEEAEAAVLQEYEVIDLTEDGYLGQQTERQNSRGRYRYRRSEPNASLGLKHRSSSICKVRDVDLKVNSCVELREPIGKWEVQFLEVKSICTSGTDGQVTILGLGYARNRNLRGALENKRNEVCQIIEVDADDQRPDETQALVKVSLQQILQVRTLHKTNAIYPQHRYGDDPRWNSKTSLERERQGPLTCRWRYRVQYRDARFRRYGKPDAWVLVRMMEAEVDQRFACSDKEIRAAWRGRTSLGGSYRPDVIQLDGLGVPMARSDRQYTFADLFCGAGGASRGAVMVGLKLSFGVDHWPVACETWRRNFPGIRLYEQDATDFIHNLGVDYRSHPIDILHLSPPCQFWSPLAYPWAGRNNEENMAILFSCPELIKKLRPRLFTLEQTFGLTHAAHAEFLNALIQGFTSHGYSVQWKIVSLVDYGLPQTRKRLIMIGACPGEQLPPWPPATHSATPVGGQKPFVTEAQAIQNLNRRRVSLHDVTTALVRNSPPRDGNSPFSKTITCSGTQGAYHFSGLRDYTLREIACLQGFPVSHEFQGTKTAIKKQIGNAFPSCVVKVIYEHLRDWLKRVDGVQGVSAHAIRPVPRAVELLPRRRRSIPAVLPIAPRHQLNGGLDENEALELALQESKRGPYPPAGTGVIELSDDEDQQDLTVSTVVAPLLERMSIGPRAVSVAASRSRSRSVTLGFSPSPEPLPHHRAASQKRSLDSMQDGEVGNMDGASPPKRERTVEAVDERDGFVTVNRAPSRLPQYASIRDTDGADDYVLVGELKRAGIQGSQTDASMLGKGSSSSRGVTTELSKPSQSLFGGLITLDRTSAGGDETWLF